MEIHDKEIINNFLNGNKGDKVGLKCPKCGSDMIVRIGHNKFLGCSAFPRCKETFSWIQPRDCSIHKQVVDNVFDFIQEEFETYLPINCKDDMLGG